MVRTLRSLIPLSIVLAVVGVPALAGAATYPGCANPADSALNQYCDSLPSSGGPQTPGAGGPTVGTTLPRTTAKLIAAQGGVSGGGSGAAGREEAARPASC